MRLGAIVLLAVLVGTPLCDAFFGATATGVLAVAGGFTAVKVLKLVGLAKLRKLTEDDHHDDDYYYGESPYYGSTYSNYNRRPYQPVLGGSPPYFIVPASNLGSGNGRFKRAVQRIPVPAEVEPSQSVSMEEAGIQIARGLDPTDCDLMIVCEIAAIPEDTRQEVEKLIIAPFSDTKASPQPTSYSSARYAYEQASWLGRNPPYPEFTCAKTYNKCRFTKEEFMEIFKQLEAQEATRENEQNPQVLQ